MLPRRAIRRWLPTSTSRGVLQAIALLATRWRDDYEHWSKFWRAIANVATLTPARTSDRITAFTNCTNAPTWSCLGIVCPFRQKKVVTAIACRPGRAPWSGGIFGLNSPRRLVPRIGGCARRGFTMTPAGLRPLQDLRRTLHGPPTQLPQRSSTKHTETSVASADSTAIT